MSHNLPWDANYSTRMLNFVKELNTLSTSGQKSESSILLHSSSNLFLRLDWPLDSSLFPCPVDVKITLHANMSTNPKPDGIRILWANLLPVHSSPISHLSQILLKENIKMESFKLNFADKQETMGKKCKRLMDDLEVFAREKQEMKENLLKKSLLLINQKKIKILNQSAQIKKLQEQNEKLQKDLFESQTMKKKNGKRKVKKK